MRLTPIAAAASRSTLPANEAAGPFFERMVGPFCGRMTSGKADDCLERGIETMWIEG
jgi:hypothetical protein